MELLGWSQGGDPSHTRSGLGLLGPLGLLSHTRSPSPLRVREPGRSGSGLGLLGMLASRSGSGLGFLGMLAIRTRSGLGFPPGLGSTNNMVLDVELPAVNCSDVMGFLDNILQSLLEAFYSRFDEE